MSTSSDKRRPELVVPYVHRVQKVDKPSAMFTNTMPLAAMFMRNKLLAWVAMFTALQSFLNEPFTQQSDAQPTWTSLVTALVGLVTCYMDFVIPPKPKVPTQQPVA